jgi:hypothetical protein
MIEIILDKEEGRLLGEKEIKLTLVIEKDISVMPPRKIQTPYLVETNRHTNKEKATKTRATEMEAGSNLQLEILGPKVNWSV